MRENYDRVGSGSEGQNGPRECSVEVAALVIAINWYLAPQAAETECRKAQLNLSAIESPGRHGARRRRQECQIRETPDGIGGSFSFRGLRDRCALVQSSVGAGRENSQLSSTWGR